VALECLRQRMVHVVDEYRRLSSVPSANSAPDTVPSNQELFLHDNLSECSVRRTRKFMVLFFVRALWKAVSSLIKRVPEGKSSNSKIKSGSFDPRTLSLWNLATHSPVKVTATMTGVHLKDPFPSTRQRRGPLGAYSVVRVMLQANAVSSMTAKEWRDLSLERDRLSEVTSSVNALHDVVSKSSKD